MSKPFKIGNKIYYFSIDGDIIRTIREAFNDNGCENTEVVYEGFKNIRLVYGYYGLRQMPKRTDVTKDMLKEQEERNKVIRNSGMTISWQRAIGW